jgi:hypothetical protein
MSIIGSNILAGASGQAGGGYEIERSVRFSSSDSSFLSRTPASAGNRRTYTISFWLKTSVTNTSNRLFGARNDANNYMEAYIRDTNKINWYFWGGGIQYELVTTQVFRDPSAWYHLMFVLDTTQATANNRIRIYANGSEITAFDTRANPSLNFECSWNNTVANRIGVSVDTSSAFLNGSLADIHLIDSQALTPTSFGKFDTNGVWQPKAFSGSYGTSGFHLPFSDNSTAAALGTDTSGNGNDWTVNNISVTAGAGNDSLVDSPVNGSQVDTGVGGEVVGNYCTWNPLDNYYSSNTLSNGNLDVVTPSGANYAPALGTFAMSSGKWYWEIVWTGSNVGTGICAYVNANDYLGGQTTGYSYQSTGEKRNNATSTSYGSSYTFGDVIGVALNMDAGTLTFYKNNVSQGAAYTGLSGSFKPAISDTTGSGSFTATANFGQRQWAYAAPAGFKALCTTNLPEPTIADGSTAMDVALYTGNGSTQTISGLNFSPDLVWCKVRGIGSSHNLWDAVRGPRIQLQSNTPNSEYTESAGYGLTAFNSDGFTLGLDNQGPGRVNSSGEAFAAWAWDAGSSTVTNTAGSITSQVRANASAGFSVVTFTSSSSVSTVGHGLGVAPYLIITKNRSVSNTWWTYHNAIGNTKAMRLDTTAAETTISSTWNNTSPTSTVFTVGGEWGNGNNIVAYCFAPVAGYSSFGSYISNASSDGPFVYTGFRPRWLMIKLATSEGTRNWIIIDAARNTYNTVNNKLAANSDASENNAGVTGDGSQNLVDFLSNGFKLRTGNGDTNGLAGYTYIYAAVAESPFQYARAR